MTAPHVRRWPVASRACHALLAAALSAAAAQPAPLSAQTMPAAQPSATAAAESVTVVAGAEYRASRLHQDLLGREYRDLWTTPVRVPVLDLARTAGGLTPTRRGGGNQTVALRLKGADGREYQFRSLDKVQTRTLPPGFQRTLVSRMVQDQVAALHPASALVAAPLMQAAGVLHAEPALYVMPDDPRLGAFRGEFAGRLGTLELRPDEGEGGADNFAHARAIVSSESFLKQLEKSATHQVDAPDYLTSRLMDLYFGDWDRYEDQYRWARFDSGGVHRWRPIPRDHDYAFTDSEGTLIALMRTRLPKASAFRGEYPKDLYWLIAGAQNIDPRLLAPLERSAWDSVSLALQARLTDAVIDDAVRSMPPEYHALNGERLARTLRARRDALPAMAMRFYTLLAEAPEVHATDESEQAEVERIPDGSVVVRLWAPSRGAAPYFKRRFRPAETHEVRLYMHGGDDQVRVYGTAQRGLLVRVIGGGGRDLLQDSGRVRASGVYTAFYDTDEHTRFVTNTGTRVDRRTYREPPWTPGDPDDPDEPPRTSGGSGPKLVPYLNWSPNLGPVIGGGLAWTRFGFRQQPYASKGRLVGMWAPFSGGVAADFTGDFRPVDSRASLLLHARASHLDRFNFFGFGNDTRREGPNSRFRAPLDVVTVNPLYLWLLGRGADARCRAAHPVHGPRAPRRESLSAGEPVWQPWLRADRRAGRGRARPPRQRVLPASWGAAVRRGQRLPRRVGRGGGVRPGPPAGGNLPLGEGAAATDARATRRRAPGMGEVPGVRCGVPGRCAHAARLFHGTLCGRCGAERQRGAARAHRSGQPVAGPGRSGCTGAHRCRSRVPRRRIARRLAQLGGRGALVRLPG